MIFNSNLNIMVFKFHIKSVTSHTAELSVINSIMVMVFSGRNLPVML